MPSPLNIKDTVDVIADAHFPTVREKDCLDERGCVDQQRFEEAQEESRREREEFIANREDVINDPWATDSDVTLTNEIRDVALLIDHYNAVLKRLVCVATNSYEIPAKRLADLTRMAPRTISAVSADPQNFSPVLLAEERIVMRRRQEFESAPSALCMTTNGWTSKPEGAADNVSATGENAATVVDPTQDGE